MGPRLAHAGPARAPERRTSLDGRFCRLEPIADAHARDLYAASTPADAAARFLYLSDEPPASIAETEAWIARAKASSDPLVFAVIDKRSGRCEGRQSFLRITPVQRSIEIGAIYWGPAIARSPATTEALFLFARHAFEDLGYRRFEWKCDALNAPSRRAALRFGFTFEGHFRRAAINKGRTRDTTWFAIIDEEWPRLRQAYEQWLDPANFDAAGQQRAKLGELTAAALHADR
ncbi:MAG: GNAT family N-acetyltransferase [Proteobacteria bacterium]|nr:GNAT family N-acetyltransferase [Pseudomonadota bacterium]